MHYFGGKSRIARFLCEVMEPYARGKVFGDLFCGACNVVAGMSSASLRYANDNNPMLIAMYKALMHGWEPPAFVTENDYQQAMDGKLPWPETAFILSNCSYVGKWRGGYGRGVGRNYAMEGRRSLLRMRGHLQGVQFSSFDYSYAALFYPKGSVLYCDPPYKGKKADYYSRSFDQKRFRTWVEQHKTYYQIFISEYKENVEPSWTIVWEKASRMGVRDGERKMRRTMECLALAT